MYTPLSCLLSQNDKGGLDLPTNCLKKALCGRDWVVMESLDLLHQIIKLIWQRNKTKRKEKRKEVTC